MLGRKSIAASISRWIQYQKPCPHIIHAKCRPMSTKLEPVTQSTTTPLASQEKGKAKKEREKLSTSNKRSGGSSKAGLPLSQKYAFRRNQSKDSDESAETTPPPQHIIHRTRMKELFPEGWNPPRKLSRDAMEGLRALHRVDPQQFSTPILAARFRISPEAVRRILRSRWQPNKAERGKLVEREMKRRREAEERARERAKERAREERQLLKEMLHGEEQTSGKEEDRLTMV